MPIEIIVPRLGWSSEEGLFAGWLKQPGDEVVAGEPLFALESDKVTMEVESLDHGFLHVPSDGPQPGQVVAVGQLLGYLLAKGEQVDTFAPGDSAAAIPVPASPVDPQIVNAVSVPPNPASSAAATPGTPVAAGQSQPLRRLVSPRARATARRLGVDLASVHARPGARRVIENDVFQAAQARKPGSASEPSPLSERAVLRARQVLAARLEESFRTPHFYLQATADAVPLARFLDEMRPHVEAQYHARLTYNDLLIKALALAVKAVPQVNHYWSAGQIVPQPAIDVSLAVQAGDSLLVPVIRHAATRTIGEIAVERECLVDKCRRGQAKPEDFHGGSVTLSNLGPFGVDRFQAILNPPQSAILAVGGIRKRPFVDGDTIVARLTVPLTISVDHRVVDGVVAARFLQTLVEWIEAPMRLVL